MINSRYTIKVDVKVNKKNRWQVSQLKNFTLSPNYHLKVADRHYSGKPKLLFFNYLIEKNIRYGGNYHQFCNLELSYF